MDKEKSIRCEYLFSYGTLQMEKVQLASFGRKLNGSREELSGFRVEQLRITDKGVLEKSGQEFHPIAIKTDNELDKIDGMLFSITSDELRKADEYEVKDYERVKVKFNSGKKGWIYTKP